MPKKDSIFIELLKKYTTIDKSFINTFFKKFKIGGELDFDIKDSDVAEYLGIKINTLRRRLMNEFSKTKIYFEKVDYVKIKSGTSNAGIKYMVNYQCFERLAMTGDSEQSEVVRGYFIKLREFITENQHLIYQAVTNNTDLNNYTNMESIYFFAVDDRKFNFKIGRTKDIIKRLQNYNVGRIKDFVYHLEHARSENSWTHNPHMESNHYEWLKLSTMNKEELIKYYSKQDYLKKYVSI